MTLFWHRMWTLAYGLGIILTVWVAITISHLFHSSADADSADECFAQVSYETDEYPMLVFGCGRDPSTYFGIRRMPDPEKENQYVDMLVLAPDVFPQCATVASFMFNHKIAPAGITIDDLYTWTDFVLCNEDNQTGVYMPFLETSKLLSAIAQSDSLTFLVGKSASPIRFKNKEKAIQDFITLSQQLFAEKMAA